MFIDNFQEKIWKDKYQYKGETFREFCERIAGNIFYDNENLRDKLYNYIYNGYIVFGGRINSNIGVEEQGLTLFNCFIESVGENPDSLEGIMDMVTRYIITLKTEGGVGFCANFLRPANTLIRKIGVTTPGSIKFLELFDKASEIITAGSVSSTNSFQGQPFKKSIRKGATMVTMSISHPDIEEFITAKSIPNRLTKMNMSVLVSDAFMYAVENDLDWALWFPDINYEKYETEWFGDMENWASKGYPVIVYKTVKAKDLWDLLLQNTYSRNEPGVLFIDSARNMDNLWYLEYSSILGTNPCCVGNTRLSTGNGMIKLLDLYKAKCDNTVVVDNRACGSDRGTSYMSATRVVKTVENSEVFKVTTKAGYELKCTDYHEFYTNRGKIKLKDLNVGDKIFISSGPGLFGSNGDIDIGRIVGMVAGGGTIYSGYYVEKDNYIVNRVYLRLWGKDKELCDYFSDEINKLIGDYKVKGTTYQISTKFNDDRDMVELSSSVLYRFFADLGLFDIKNSVPEYVFTGTKECVKGYLQGLFQADGYVAFNDKSNTCSVRLSSSIETLLKDVQILLTGFGVFSKIYKRRSAGYRDLPDGHGGTKKYYCKDNYELIIDGSSREIFMSDIGFMLDYKNDVYNNWVKGKKLYKKEKYETSITSIEYCGKEDVFCLTQPDTNSCVFNGIVTGQCGEVFGTTGRIYTNKKWKNMGDICDLGSLNLVKFYDPDTEVFDTDKFLDVAALLVDALDRVIEISNYPLDEYRDAALLKRKIGVGIMGFGSLMMMMDIRYGSSECIEFLNGMLYEFMNCLYRTSALLAKEKGPFPLYDEKIFEGGYIKNSGNLSDSTLELIKKHGLRNSALSAIAPNGTGSILAGNVSGGLEPVFAKEFTRWNRVEGQEKKFDYPNVGKGEWYETDYFKEETLAGDVMLLSTDGEYRVDKNNGLCKRNVIKDYGYKIAESRGFRNTAGATELTIEEHLKVLGVFAKYVDLSCSKTINLPNEITFEEFKELYGKLHKFGIKGCTTYRTGTMVGILETSKKEEKEKTIKEEQQEFLDTFKDHNNGVVVDQVSLPTEYPARGYILRSEGKKWYLHVAFKDKDKTKPFALFVNTNSREDNVSTFNALENLAELAKNVGLNGELLAEVQRKYGYQKNPVKICRMIGFLLRHNVDVFYIVKTLDGVEEATAGSFVHRIKKFLSQFIYEVNEPVLCPECNSKSLVFREGCYLCTQCMHTRC